MTREEERIVLALSRKQAQAVEDALSYYESVSANNFDMGYEGDREAYDAHRSAAAVRRSITRQMERGDA